MEKAKKRKTLREWLRDLSLRKALVLSTVVTAAAAVAAILGLGDLISDLRQAIIEPFLTEVEFAPGLSTWVLEGTMLPPDVDFWYRYGGDVGTLTVALCIVGAVIGEAFAFYRWKLKNPLEALHMATRKIADNDLDFQMAFLGTDEMGTLCSSFETMRAALEENYRAMWRSAEERKRLNAAFSHDLRTPLTVLRGYTELLEKYLPEGKLPPEKVAATVAAISAQAARLERYTESMSAMQRLEDLPVDPEPVAAAVLAASLEEAGKILCQGREAVFTLRAEGLPEQLFLDAGAVSQVFENLTANAARYAGGRVAALLRMSGPVLELLVADNGPGFSAEGLRRAADPFYHEESGEGDREHFGLGLHICRVLCEKHGGGLTVANSLSGGGCVTARFRAGIPEKSGRS